VSAREVGGGRAFSEEKKEPTVGGERGSESPEKRSYVSY